MSWKAFFHSLAAAAFGGAATGATAVLSQPGAVQWRGVAASSAAGALVGALALLKQSPLAPADPAPEPPSPEPKD
jgi:hypothetical protein